MRTSRDEPAGSVQGSCSAVEQSRCCGHSSRPGDRLLGLGAINFRSLIPAGFRNASFHGYIRGNLISVPGMGFIADLAS